MATFLFGVKPWDPGVFVFAPLAADADRPDRGQPPGHAGHRMDPIVALRYE